MEPKPFSLADGSRLLLGDASWPFLIEVVIRAGLTYVLIMFAMRLLGRRVASQYTMFELSVVVTLAGAIGVPLQAQERGMLPPLIIMAAVIAFQWCAARMSIRHPKVERVVFGKVLTVLQDGRLKLDTLRKTVLSREKVFALLRRRGIQQLGQLSRVYIEPSGALSIVWSDHPGPGLPIVPEIDSELRQAMAQAGHFACGSCGLTVQREHPPETQCVHCHARQWTPAALEMED